MSKYQKDDLGTRMKGYENVSRNYLTRRIPVIIRLDGKSFHTFTKGLTKPFDDVLVKCMQETMKYLCENIQGCVLGYTQSDEVTLVLVDYKKLDSDAWFDNNIQKMASISASIATMIFNKTFFNEYLKLSEYFKNSEYSVSKENIIYMDTLYNKIGNAMFDSRVFNIPKEEVCNCLIWRQQDAVRNSIQSVGQANFSQKQLYNKSCNMIQDMLMTEKNINWNDINTHLKRGSCCVKENYFIPQDELNLSNLNSMNLVARTLDPEEDEYGVYRTKWNIDFGIPTFTQNREYIEKLINF